MNKRTLKARSELYLFSEGHTTKISKRVSSKASKQILYGGKKPQRGMITFSDETANYYSDFTSSGANTPYSCFSSISRSTRNTAIRRRDKKSLRKLNAQYKQDEAYKGGYLLRSLTFG